MKKIFTLLAAMLLVPWGAWGQSNAGDFKVSEGNASYEKGVLTIREDATVSNTDPSIATDDRIIIKGGSEGSPVNVTLGGVNIINNTNSPITISAGSYVKLNLLNENYIGGAEWESSTINLPMALQIESSSDYKTQLEISGTGSLTAYASNVAIGAYNSKTASGTSNFTLTISGGEITAKAVQDRYYTVIGGFNSSNFTINIKGGKVEATSGAYANGWLIGGNNATINISGGEVISAGGGNAIGGNATKINVTGGNLDLAIIKNTSVAIGDDNNKPNSEINISKGHVYIHSDGSSDNIQGSKFSTGEDGDAIIIIDATKTAKGYWSMNVPRENVSDWKGVIFERQIKDMVDFGENGSQPLYSLDGYIYGSVTLAEDITIVDGQSMTIVDGANFIETNHSLNVDGGDIYLAYENENKKNNIDGNGTYHYEIFYDENLKFPEELQNITIELEQCVVLSDYLPHDHKSTRENEAYRVRYDYSNNDEEMLFGEEGETLTFVWNEEAQLGDLFNPSPTEGWVLESIKAVKTKTTEAITNTSNTSFTMPSEAVTITDFTLKKKPYTLSVNKCPEEFEVHFENEAGDIITESEWDETVYIIVTAPGFDSYEITKIQEFYNISGPEITATDTKGRYYLTMPKKDVRINIEGSASTQLTYKVEVDKNIQHGAISIDYGEGVNEEAIHYKDKIIVHIDNIEEGYELQSLKYIKDTGEKVEIAYDEEAKEYSFTMPAANVTVTAVFAEIKYTVTIAKTINGTVTILDEEDEIEAPAEFDDGAIVTLNPVPDEGYELSSLTYTGKNGELMPIKGVSFTMPAHDVIVNATFTLKPTTGGEDEESGIAEKRYRLYLADQDFYLNDEYDEAGLVLYSRHDKKYTDVGSSFTIWFEKYGEVNEGARVFISNRANGEYKEVKLDEVSGYYQIRNVQSNIYVKLYTEEGFPVANENIEATEARAYAQANKIVVITPEPTDVQIISMAGAVVATAQVAGQQEFANLAEGVYIVRMGENIVKLQVRN